MRHPWPDAGVISRSAMKRVSTQTDVSGAETDRHAENTRPSSLHTEAGAAVTAFGTVVHLQRQPTAELTGLVADVGKPDLTQTWLLFR